MFYCYNVAKMKSITYLHRVVASDHESAFRTICTRDLDPSCAALLVYQSTSVNSGSEIHQTVRIGQAGGQRAMTGCERMCAEGFLMLVELMTENFSGVNRRCFRMIAAVAVSKKPRV
jgi:hypothetical protein